MVSVLGDYTYEFPKEFPLELRLKDMLEEVVDEKFYLSDAMINYCIGVGQKGGKFPRKERFLQNLNREHQNIGNSITTNEGNRPVSNFIWGDCEKLNRYIDDYEDDEKLLKVLNGSEKPKVIAGIGEKKSNGGTQWYQQDRIYDDNVAISVTTGFNPYYKVNDPFICASRGRNPGNPSDRRAGIPTEQRLEANFSGCSNTLTTVQKDNYVVEPFINRIDIPQMVKVRKYEVNCKALCEALRAHKQAANLSNKEIAEQLNVPFTNVEHWFRQDNSFSIPDAKIWFDLKKLLGVETNEFDEAITTFEEKEGVFEKSNRCYLSDGIAPTITSASADEKVIEPLAYYEQNGYIRKDGTVGTLTTDGSSPKHNNRVVEPIVWDGYNQRIRKEPGTVGSLTTNCGADFKRNGQGIIEPIVCEQRADEGLRFFKGDYCGALRTIDACGDKRVIEATPTEIIREEPLERDGWHRHAKEVLSTQGVYRTLAAQSNNLVTKIKEPYSFRIRKLTPKECWRLMGFDDADFDKAAAEISNTQLYKQAGNSIVVDVLYYIFRNMLEVKK